MIKYGQAAEEEKRKKAEAEAKKKAEEEEKVFYSMMSHISLHENKQYLHKTHVRQLKF